MVLTMVTTKWLCYLPRRPCHDHTMAMMNHHDHVVAWSSCLNMAVNLGSQFKINKKEEIVFRQRWDFKTLPNWLTLMTVSPCSFVQVEPSPSHTWHTSATLLDPTMESHPILCERYSVWLQKSFKSLIIIHTLFWYYKITKTWWEN